MTVWGWGGWGGWGTASPRSVPLAPPHPTPSNKSDSIIVYIFCCVQEAPRRRSESGAPLPGASRGGQGQRRRTSRGDAREHRGTGERLKSICLFFNHFSTTHTFVVLSTRRKEEASDPTETNRYMFRCLAFFSFLHDHQTIALRLFFFGERWWGGPRNHARRNRVLFKEEAGRSRPIQPSSRPRRRRGRSIRPLFEWRSGVVGCSGWLPRGVGGPNVRPMLKPT